MQVTEKQRREASITVRRELDKVKLVVSAPNLCKSDVVELELSPEDARKLGRALISSSESSAIQMEHLLRRLAEVERLLYTLSERVKNLESTVRQ